MRNMIKKVIVPTLVITVLFAVLRPLCIQDGKQEGDDSWIGYLKRLKNG